MHCTCAECHLSQFCDLENGSKRRAVKRALRKAAEEDTDNRERPGLTQQVSAELDIFMQAVHDTELAHSVEATHKLLNNRDVDYER
uniref:Uncharacterized protein n=1 Tax=Glossina austeni TaxID=7395 RepID=A0A1A9V7G7_GLOAU